MIRIFLFIGYEEFSFHILYIINAFAVFSVYKMGLKSVSCVFFSVTIISAPCSRSVKVLKVFFFGHLDYWYQVQPVVPFCHREKNVVCRLAVFVLKLFSLYSQFEGELYLLATDQGYINQPDLVWEKLNEVKQYCFMIFLLR